MCANSICVGYASEKSGLCLSCELRCNTNDLKFKERLCKVLRKEYPSFLDMEIFFREAKRRGVSLIAKELPCGYKSEK